MGVAEEGGETSETTEEELPAEAPPILKHLETPTENFTPARIPGKNLFVCLGEHHLRLMSKFWWAREEQAKIVRELQESGDYANVKVKRWDIPTQKLFTGLIVAAEDVVGMWFNTGMQERKKSKNLGFSHELCLVVHL